jgi:hypothetical protein
MTALSKHWRQLPLADLEGLAAAMSANGQALSFTDHQKIGRVQRRLAKLRRRQKKAGNPEAAGVTV